MLLKFLRKRKNMKRIMWGLAIIIIPAFVVWGAGTSAKNKGNRPDYAGKLFGKKISHEDYYNMWNVARDYAVKSFGNNVPDEFVDQMAWSRIMLLEEAKRQNLAVTDQELIEKIVSFPVFQKRGAFDKKFYKSMLGDTAKQFEEKFRDDLLISKLKDRITSSISVSDEEAKSEYKKKFEKIKSSYALIPFADSEKEVEMADPVLENFYNENKASFKKSEQINIKYLEIQYSMFDRDVAIKDEQIKRFFEEHLNEFKKPDSEANPVLDDAIKNSIRERLSFQNKVSMSEELGYKVMDQVNQKKNLEEPGKANSIQVNETGFFSMEEEVPGIGWSYEFAKAGFELEKNRINNMLIKTDKGLYIIQLKDKKAPYVPDYSEVKDAVKKTYIKEESIKLSQKKSADIFLDISNVIKNNVKFEEAVKKYGLQVKQTDLISRDGYIPEIGPAKEFVDRAFSAKTGQISEPFKSLQGWVMLEPLESKDIDEVKFIEEKDKFKENLLANKKEAEFNKYFEGLQKRAEFVSYTGKQ
ncbi:MAG: SurA N-terminal domain-containing protein [Candidatus Omnitrophota bacterium]